MYKQIDKEVSFVLSTGRTGTVALSKILNINNNTKAIHEPNKSRRFMILSKYVRNGLIKEEWVKKYFFKIKHDLWSEGNEQQLIEVNPFNWNYGKYICQYFENPKVLYVVRDIPAWCSCAHKSW